MRSELNFGARLSASTPGKDTVSVFWRRQAETRRADVQLYRRHAILKQRKTHANLHRSLPAERRLRDVVLGTAGLKARGAVLSSSASASRGGLSPRCHVVLTSKATG